MTRHTGPETDCLLVFTHTNVPIPNRVGTDVGTRGRLNALGRDTYARSGDDGDDARGNDGDGVRGNDGDEVRGVRAELVARRRWTRTTRGRDAGGAFEREDDGVEWEQERQRERWGREDEREEEGRRGGESAPGTHS